MPALFDIRTTALLSGVMGLIFSLHMAYVHQTRRTHPGFAHWSLAAFMFLLGSVMIGSRHLLPDLVSVVMGNATMVLALGLIATGLAVFWGGRPDYRWTALAVAASIAASAVFTYAVPSVSRRIVASSLITILVLLQCLRLARPPNRTGPGRDVQAKWLALNLAALAIWMAARTALTVVYESDSKDLLAPSLIQGTSFILNSALSGSILLGLLDLHARRTVAELRQAVVQRRPLEGIIPICMTCKKIRDERGAWNQLESYITGNSSAKFSHGYCPDCAKRTISSL